MEGLSIDALKRNTGVTDHQLDRRIHESDLPPLAACFDSTEYFVEKLGLSPGEQVDVKTIEAVKGTQAGMGLALKYWRNRNPVEATFRALLLILLSLGKADVATQVCKYVRDTREPVGFKPSHMEQDMTVMQDTREDVVRLKPSHKKLENLLRSFKQKLKNKETVNQTVMQVILHGNAGVGKTSLTKVLSGNRASEHEPSTGIMEEPKQIEISTIFVEGARSKMKKWKLLDLNEEAGLVVGLANRQHATSCEPTLLQPKPIRATESSYQQGEEPLQSQDIRLSETITDSEALQKASYIMEKLEEEPWTLYVSDVGGQLEFQELIPALTSGPSLHLIVLSAEFELDESFPVVYRKSHKRDDDTKPYYSSHSVKENVLQQISAILSTGQKRKIIFILTHTDTISTDPKVISQRIKEIDKKLEELIAGLSLDAFEYAEEDQLCHPISNIKPKSEDVHRIRETVERIGRYYKCETSYSCLHFSIALREKKSHVLTYEQCADIGYQCGIPDKKGIDDALEFLHYKVGAIRFFSKDQLLKDIVIVKPSILFDNVTRLLEDTFTFSKVPQNQLKEFRSKGLFTSEQALSRIETGNKLFTKEKFLAFLEHQYILAQVIDKSGLKFFLPSSLVHVDAQKDDRVQTHPPLLIAFSTSTHFVPRGVFGFMIAQLLADTPEELDRPTLMTDKIYRNQVTFAFGPYQDEFRLLSFPEYIPIDVFESEPNMVRKTEFQLPKICCMFKKRIEDSLKKILGRLNYTEIANPVPAFFCTKCDQPHPAHFYDSRQLSISCSVKGCRVLFPPNYQIWFNKVAALSSGLPVTLESLKQTYPHCKFALKIPENDICILADCFDDVENYLYAMGLTQGEIVDVRNKSHTGGNQQAMTACLKLWMNHNPHEATLQKLLTILLRLRKESIACQVCQHFNLKHSSSEAHLSGPPIDTDTRWVCSVL